MAEKEKSDFRGNCQSRRYVVLGKNVLTIYSLVPFGLMGGGLALLMLDLSPFCVFCCVSVISGVVTPPPSSSTKSNVKYSDRGLLLSKLSHRIRGFQGFEQGIMALLLHVDLL